MAEPRFVPRADRCGAFQEIVYAPPPAPAGPVSVAHWSARSFWLRRRLVRIFRRILHAIVLICIVFLCHDYNDRCRSCYKILFLQAKFWEVDRTNIKRFRFWYCSNTVGFARYNKVISCHWLSLCWLANCIERISTTNYLRRYYYLI